MALIVHKTPGFPFVGLKSVSITIPGVGEKDGSFPFYLLSGKATNNELDTTTTNGQALSYNRCPAVTQVVNKKVRAHLNGRFYLEDKDGNEPKTPPRIPFTKFMSGFANPLQRMIEFNAQVKGYLQIFGEAFIYKLKATETSEVVALWCIPNTMIRTVTTGKAFLQSKIEEIVTGYEIITTGRSIPVRLDEVIHIRDNSIVLFNDVKKIAGGQSRLYPLSDVVTNVTAAYEARGVMITRRGALGILSSDAKDPGGIGVLTNKEKERVQAEMQNYGLSKRQWQMIITSANMKWSSITLPVKDLGLFEEVEAGTVEIANALEYPPYLLGYKNNSTFNNVAEAKLALYQDVIIPESSIITEAFTNDQDLGIAKSGLKLVAYYDHLPIFQRSDKEKWDGFKSMNEAFKAAVESGAVDRSVWTDAINNYLG